ncbi:hypothetical protein KI387_043834 [Taxus chinensis]|uniref:Uncharacterized protein n=1 Tax=Taxus chinensis TaxID=29808 RepID=A0AA38KZL2_TAXCH|nr:hypothetical protein KI387_043834 [Taxus chinensis]
MVWWAGQRAARVAQPTQPDLAAMTAEREISSGVRCSSYKGKLAPAQAQIGGLTGAASPGSGTGTGSSTTTTSIATGAGTSTGSSTSSSIATAPGTGTDTIASSGTATATRHHQHRGGVMAGDW